MLRRIVLFVIAVALALNISGCSAQSAAKETIPVASESREEVKAAAVSVSEQCGERTLKMDVQVSVPHLEKLETVKLAFDEELLDTMVEELAKSQYPDIKEESVGEYRDWSVQNEKQLLFTLSCWDSGFDAGRVGYLDVTRDLNGQSMGEDEVKWRIPHYLTEHIPYQIGLPAADAAKEMGAFLSKYSCFAYEPWNVTAHNCNNDPEISGYYSADMQPHYDGLPVYGEGQLMISAHMSAEGVFAFQGVMVLKEQERAGIRQAMPLETAVERFKEDFAAGWIEGSVIVDRITVGYVARSGYQGTYTLSPAWVFECTELPESADGAGSLTHYPTYAYLMETGKFLFDDL